jgi:VWFA-related protein
MGHPARALLTALLLTALPGPPAGAQEEPAPVPFIEREEVRFITLDIVAEERAGGWRPLRDLTLGQIEVRLGDRLIAVDQFDNLCPSGPALESAPASDATPVTPQPSPAGSPGIALSLVEGDRYILYFDMEHLDLAGRDASFKAALAWAGGRLDPADEVMIITGGRGLRIVRTFLPAADHLREDLEAARGDFRASELWGAFESMRLEELGQEKNRAVRQMQADAYAQIDRSKTRNSLSNLRDIMTIFDAVDGTKNLVLFSDTLRLIPGAQYGNTSTPLIDVQTELHDLAGAANERNVRVYPVKVGLPIVWPRSDPRMSLADSALTMLAHETGGMVFEGSNAVDGAFDRVNEDLACFYRVGFRIRPRYSGGVEPIRVRVVGREDAVRLRYRQTLEDPTREELDADMIRAAFMAPMAARTFPIGVRATKLFRQDGGARLQVEVGTPLGALLGLPMPGGVRGSRQVRVQIGARVVPLRPLEDGDRPPSPRGGVWADVATDRPSSGFGRQAVLTLPPNPTPDRSYDRVVATEEFDAPSGRYRIVAVIQDQLARTVSAAIADLEVGSDAPRLGIIGLASGDTHAVLAQDEPADPAVGDGSSREAAGWNGKELTTAMPLLPPGALLNEVSVVQAGGAAHLFYSVCVDWNPRGRNRSRSSGRSSRDMPSPEQDLVRSLTCGPEDTPIPLPPRSLPQGGRGTRCVPMIESIPAADLHPGRCRFEVRLTSPGGEQEMAVREFTVVPPTGRDTTVTGSLRPRHDPPGSG